MSNHYKTSFVHFKYSFKPMLRNNSQNDKYDGYCLVIVNICNSIANYNNFQRLTELGFVTSHVLYFMS